MQRSTTFGRRMYWHDRAACREEDPELFFPTATSGPDHDRQVTMAKSVCERCDVRHECLEDAIARQIKDGIWGGLTDVERKRLALTGGTRRGRILA